MSGLCHRSHPLRQRGPLHERELRAERPPHTAAPARQALEQRARPRQRAARPLRRHARHRCRPPPPPPRACRLPPPASRTAPRVLAPPGAPAVARAHLGRRARRTRRQRPTREAPHTRHGRPPFTPAGEELTWRYNAGAPPKSGEKAVKSVYGGRRSQGAIRRHPPCSSHHRRAWQSGAHQRPCVLLTRTILTRTILTPRCAGPTPRDANVAAAESVPCICGARTCKKWL